MGIDIYLYWEGQTEEEKQAQFTGFDITAGHVGYLREAYHGGPYATRVLVPEAFNWTGDEDAEDGALIPARTMKDRLPATLKTVQERYHLIYTDSSAKEIRLAQKAFRDFVRLAQRKEKETGKPCRVMASY